MKRILVRACCAAASLYAAACSDSFLAHGAPSLRARIQPQMSVEARAAFDLVAQTAGQLGNVRIRITHPPADPFEAVFPFPSGSDVADFSVDVPSVKPDDRLVVEVALMVADQVYYTGGMTVTVTAGQARIAAPIHLAYVGPVMSLSIANGGTLEMIDSLPLAVTARDLAGHLIGGRTITFSSSATAVATVSATGLVKPVGPGNATITASIEGRTATASIVVESPIISLSTAFATTSVCAVRQTGAAYCGGENNFGQVGNGTSSESSPVGPVTGGLLFTSVAQGGYHACGIAVGGTAHCWGRNGDGALGDGTNTQRLVPTPVALGLTFTQIDASGAQGVSGPNGRNGNTCAVATDGTAYCWGYNQFGQLGNGTTANRSTPGIVSGGLVFSSVSTGFLFTCGLTTGGAAYCWGDNPLGRLGIGVSGSRLVPTPVAGGLTFAAISAGNGHACGITTAGAAYCWGRNGNGELGIGTTDANAHLSPEAVTGGFTFVSITTGFNRSCGILASGLAYCWGLNTGGQLGDETKINRSAPTLVNPSGRNLRFSAISAREELSTYAITVEGSPWWWGTSRD